MPIKIVSKKDGFRRAGVAHFGSKVYSDDHFTEEQLLALAGEPNLDFSVIDENPTAEKQEKKEEQEEQKVVPEKGTDKKKDGK